MTTVSESKQRVEGLSAEVAAWRAGWFWYAILSIICWAMWSICAKLGSREIPAGPMQMLFTFGALPVALGLLVARRFRVERSVPGLSYGIAKGILSGLGGIALFAAYRSTGNAATVTAATAMYPVVTVILAVTILRERLSWIQVVGLGFAVVAFVAFS
jgi:bacterial/archaeal transporter family protein